MKKILMGAVALVAAGCATDTPLLSTSANGKPVSVPIIRVDAAERPIMYESTGAVRAMLNATLSSKVMARVSSVLAREGDRVARGQVLVGLDSRELAAGVLMAQANLRAATVGVDGARTALEMESKSSTARIAQAEAAIQQSRAALAAAQSKLDLVLAGPRRQERAQAHLAVIQAESTLRLARAQLDRVSGLVAEGAMPKKNLDEAQSAYDVAAAQRDTAVQGEKIAEEGSRAEDVRTAREGVAQARAAVKQSEANLAQAKAAALQAKVRSEEIRSAQAQASQSSAALRSAQVSLAYATVSAPFDGRVVKRNVDPGAMATPGSPLVALEGGDLRLETAVPESVLPHLHIGSIVRVKLDALQLDLNSKVDEIVPQGDSTSHTFLVKLTLPSSAIGVHSGMFGRALIVTGKRRAMEIPTSSVWEREGLHYVFAVNREGIARLRLVTVGDATEEAVPVLSGLSPGERIVAAGHEHLVDGTRVTPR